MVAVDVPLVHVLGRPGSAKTGVEPTEIIETDLVQETSQGSHVESLGHLPETDEDCLEFKLGNSRRAFCQPFERPCRV